MKEQVVKHTSKNLCPVWIGEVIAAVRPEVFVDRETLERAYARIQSSFEREWVAVSALDEILYGNKIDGYGKNAAALFAAWDKHGGSSIPVMAMHALNHFRIDPDSPMGKAAMITAMLAEIPNDLQYHGNDHYRKVLFHTIRLISTHNQMASEPGQAAPLTPDQAAILLIAACIHDLGHEGGDNLRNAIYTPGYMEQRSFDSARPYLEAAGLDRDTLGEIETIVFCTDITFFAGDNSPCIRMKRIFKHYFWGAEDDDVASMMIGKLRRYEDNPVLVYMAMLLHEADIGSSAGLTYEQTERETIKIMEERGLKTAGPKTVLAFLREQMGETLFTEPGKRLFGAVMADVIRRAEADMAKGRKTFYEQ